MRLPGIWTFCLHPSAMSEEDFVETESFLKSHIENMIGFDELNLTNLGEGDILSKLLSWAYFTRRKLKGVK